MSAVWFLLGVLLYMVIGAVVTGVADAICDVCWDETDAALWALIWPITLLMTLTAVAYRLTKKAMESLDGK